MGRGGGGGRRDKRENKKMFPTALVVHPVISVI